jgi:mannose-6-phosphate isomerase-like protein (cupin superfamily)
MSLSTATLNAEPEHRFIRLRAPLNVGSFGINALVLEPGQRNRIHRHRHQEEVFLVLEGTLSLWVEGEEHTFEVGELVRVAPHTRRQITNRGPGRLRLLALGGMVDHEHVSRDGEAYHSWDQVEPSAIADVPVPDDYA